MHSASCFNLDQSKILSSGNVLIDCSSLRTTVYPALDRISRKSCNKYKAEIVLLILGLEHIIMVEIFILSRLNRNNMVVN